jgi:predicted enzyme related to lactoylglutathione lyase
MTRSEGDVVIARPLDEVFDEVSSLERTLERVTTTARGAVLQPPMDPGGGQVAVLADPSGAVLGVTESPPDAEVIDRGVPGALGWAEVLSRDVEAAKAFYSAVFAPRAVLPYPEVE